MSFFRRVQVDLALCLCWNEDAVCDRMSAIMLS